MSPPRHVSGLRRRLFCWLLGVDPDLLNGTAGREWRSGAEVHLASLQAACDSLRSATDLLTGDVTAIHEWQRSVESELASLQAASRELQDATAAHAATVAALLAERRDDAQHAAGAAWKQAAERHLASLQNEADLLRSLTRRHTDQLLRVIERASELDARVVELEQADTEIAAAIASFRSAITR